MTPSNMNMTTTTQQSIVMDKESSPAPTLPTETTNATEPAIIKFGPQWCSESVQKELNQLPDFEDRYDEFKKARAEKRMDGRLRRIEAEQKTVLMAEMAQKMEEARRNFKLRKPTNDGTIPNYSSPFEQMVAEEEARNNLIAMEREQKEAFLKYILARRGLKEGEEMPPDEFTEILKYDKRP
jgi:hypothetical protein